MYEYSQIMKFRFLIRQRLLLPIKSGNFKLDNTFVDKLIKFWENKRESYKQFNNHSEIENAAKKNGFYLKEIKKIRCVLGDIKHDIDLDNYVKQIRKYYKTNYIIDAYTKIKKLFSKNRDFPIPYPFTMIYVKGGKFIMGNETNQVEKSISSYFIAGTQVTQGLWLLIMGYNPSKNNKGGKYPVENVTWYDAILFCNRLSEGLNMQKVYTIENKTYKNESIIEATVTADYSKNGFRLPTEAEWEYAAQGGKSLFSKLHRNINIEKTAWYQQNSNGETHRVGEKQPNRLGIYDMLGNVCEWCQDAWDGKSNYENTPTDGSPNEIGYYRVLRGSCYFESKQYCNAFERHNQYPGNCTNCDGFRIALNS